MNIKILLISLFISINSFASGKIVSQDIYVSASANGQVLTIDNTVSSGLKWATPVVGTGTVTSVAQTVPSFLSVAGSPITAAGTLAITLATQSANTVFAGPTGGSATSPSFRALVSADIPALPYQTSGSYITALTGDATAAGPGSVALTLATVNGNVGSFGSASNSLSVTANGKGLITAISTNSIAISQSQVTDLISNLAGKQASGNYITALTGDVTASGPGSVAASIASLAVTNAKIANTTIDLTAKVTGSLPIANGGTAASVALSAFNNLSPLTTSGDVLVYNGGNNARKAVGTNGQVLTADNTVTGGIKWATPASAGDVFIGGSGARLEKTTIGGTSNDTVCNGSNCALFNNSAGISSVTRSGTGRLKITLTSTSCASAWNCNINGFDPGGGVLLCGREDAINGAPSTTNFAFHCLDTSFADHDGNYAVVCECLK